MKKWPTAIAACMALSLPLAVSSTASAAVTYPVHTGIVSTTFWVGEIFEANASDGSQVCSTYDADWALHFSGKSIGKATDVGCKGSPIGGCDGVSTGTAVKNFTCETEKRTTANGYFPSKMTPLENPFYLDLPFDDVNNATAFKQRGTVVPWASQFTAAQIKNPDVSLMKNHWVKISDGASTCYGQIEDAGPGKYDDTNYVFGGTNAKPASKKYNNAGLDVSPSLNGCLGYKALDGDNDKVSWQFVDAAQVPAGPWTTVVTTSGVTN